MTLWHRGSIFHANKKRFKLDIHASLIGDRITRVQPLFFDSAQLRAGKGRERPATEGCGDAEQRDNSLDVGIQELPIGLKVIAEPRSHSLNKQAGSC